METPNTILVVDFGSQYTQLIARRVRELNVYAEIVAFNRPLPLGPHVKGVILSGGPASVTAAESPTLDLATVPETLPLLGICYGAQLLTQQNGGSVAASDQREYGRSALAVLEDHPLLEDVPHGSVAWMSHSDSIQALPAGYRAIAATADLPVAAFAGEKVARYGLQFHPEVSHTEGGQQVLRNFVFGICHATPDWTPARYVEETVAQLQADLAGADVLLALSGGVDSSVAAGLLHRAIGERLHCVFVDTGLLRADEYAQVLESYAHMGLNLHGFRAEDRFLNALAGVTDPETKRKTIGRLFVEIFEEEAQRLGKLEYLAQGTIYPDVIESVSVNGPSVTIKSHHNVGGLPEKMHLKVVEPLRFLFKDEVRRVGKALGLPDFLLGRHPFPGPGLAIRIPGEVTHERVRILQAADAIFLSALREFDLYDEVWQAFAVLLPVASVGVMGDERTYENVVALRAVTSVDGMTADWARLPYDFLATVSNRIINRVKGINRVVYDVSSKPPATIEWE